jgi:hypothetical protein
VIILILFQQVIKHNYAKRSFSQTKDIFPEFLTLEVLFIKTRSVLNTIWLKGLGSFFAVCANVYRLGLSATGSI